MKYLIKSLLCVLLAFTTLSAYAVKSTTMNIEYINNNIRSGYALLQNVSYQFKTIIEGNGGSLLMNPTVNNMVYPAFMMAIQPELDFCKDSSEHFISIDPSKYTGDQIVASMRYATIGQDFILECTCRGSACGIVE